MREKEVGQEEYRGAQTDIQDKVDSDKVDSIKMDTDKKERSTVEDKIQILRVEEEGLDL